MPYVKIDDGIFRNPKVVQISSSAKLIYIASICYCGQSLTDGFIPTNAARMLAADAGVSYSARFINELLSAGLWDEVRGGYAVHDYLAYNESAQKVQAKKDAARERMNQRRSHDVRANIDGTSEEVQEPTTTTYTTAFSSEKEIPPIPPEGPDDDGADGVEYPEDFEAFMRSYPKRVGKAAAYRAWRKLRPSRALQDRMIGAVKQQRMSPQWNREHGKYIPNPSTWLNEGRWDDEVEQAAPALRRLVV